MEEAVGAVIYGLLHPSDSPLSRIMRTGPLRKAGELSFGVYLVHIPMIVFFGSRFGYGPWQFCASIAATFAAAAVLSALIERPGFALGRDLGRWVVARVTIWAAVASVGAARRPQFKHMQYVIYSTRTRGVRASPKARN